MPLRKCWWAIIKRAGHQDPIWVFCLDEHRPAVQTGCSRITEECNHLAKKPTHIQSKGTSHYNDAIRAMPEGLSNPPNLDQDRDPQYTGFLGLTNANSGELQ